MKNWIRKSFAQHGCHACSQQIKNALKWKSLKCLELFNKNKTDFVRRFITMDETCIHHYTPESKQQSKQWTEAGCSAPKKTRSVPSAGKLMAWVCWDAKGILFIDYLEKGKTTGEYYSNLNQARRKNREKRPGLQKKNIFHQDNAPAHKCFGNRKIKGSALWIVGTSTLFSRFGSLWLLSLPKTQTLPRWSAFFFFESRGDCSCRGVFCRSYEEPHNRDEIMALEHRRNKCISLKGDYVKK